MGSTASEIVVSVFASHTMSRLRFKFPSNALNTNVPSVLSLLLQDLLPIASTAAVSFAPPHDSEKKQQISSRCTRDGQGKEDLTVGLDDSRLWSS